MELQKHVNRVKVHAHQMLIVTLHGGVMGLGTNLIMTVTMKVEKCEVAHYRSMYMHPEAEILVPIPGNRINIDVKLATTGLVP